MTQEYTGPQPTDDGTNADPSPTLEADRINRRVIINTVRTSWTSRMYDSVPRRQTDARKTDIMTDCELIHTVEEKNIYPCPRGADWYPRLK